MASRCLNKVMLMGNLTRDPELRYTPQGVAVCSFGLATNRRWTTQSGDHKEDAQFHRIVAWNKLAELCSQLLVKGRRIYAEGRLQYREWTGNDGVKRRDAEVVIEDMVILDSRPVAGQEQNLEEELERATMYGNDSIPEESRSATEPVKNPAKPQKEKPKSTGEIAEEENIPVAEEAPPAEERPF